MNSKYISISAIIFLLLSFHIHAQKAEKGFKNLQKNDLVKAEESFMKVLGEDSTNCAAHFGMSIVLSHEHNSAVDYFKAWDHFLLAKKNIGKLTEDDNIFLKEFFTFRDTERRNRSIQYNLDIEEKIIEDKLIKYVREENNLAVAEKFIAVYPNSKFYENVVHIRNHLEYRKAEKTNTLEAYNNFLKRFPGAAQVKEATKARNELAYLEAKKANTIEALENFLTNYPDAYHFYDILKQRDQLAFDMAQKQNTIEAFDVFMTKYPNSLQIPAAKTIQRKLMYEKAKQVNTLEAYNDFISRYPDGDLFVDIFNLKTSVLGQKMLLDAVGNKEIVKWIKGFDSDEKNDIAGGITVTPDNRIILSGTRNKLTGSGTEAWVICVDAEGKTMWNKSFGSLPHNVVKFQTSTPKGDIILAGWNSASDDSLVKKPWLFEVSNTGTGKWERNIDGKEIESIFYSSTDIFISGCNANDSLGSTLYLAKLNSDFQKLWSRDYVKQGSLYGFGLTAVPNLVMGAGGWLWKTDSQGYIQWEKMLPSGDSIVNVNSFSGGVFLINGSRNNCPYLAKMNESGVISWEKNFPAIPGKHFDFAAMLPDKAILARYQGNGDEIGFIKLNEKGDIMKEIKFPNSRASVGGSVVVNSLGEVFTVFTKSNISNTEIVVCKFVIK